MTKLLAEASEGTTSDLVFTLLYIPAPSPTGEAQPDAEVVKEVQLEDVLLEVYAQP